MKPLWRICLGCGQKFTATDENKLDRLFESHFVNTDFGRQCMGKAQLAKSYNRVDNAWCAK